MAKKKTADKLIRDVPIKDVSHEFMKIYGTKTLLDRAIPNLYDGLKPVHRRILWAMYKLNLKPGTKPLKAAKTVGDCLGDYHPHGSTSVFGAMQNMVNATESLIDGIGNWGSLTSDGAAERYVEARLSDYSWQTFFQPDLVAVTDMDNNYDDRLQEPVCLPAQTINLLVNGTSGIAVGAVTNIPSFSLQSVNKVVQSALKSEKRLTAKKIAGMLEMTKFFGGYPEDTDENKAALLQLVQTGKARITFQPDYEIVKNTIVITGFANHLKSGKALEALSSNDKVARYIDETSIEQGTRYVIEAKRGVKLDEATVASILKPFHTAETFSIAYTTYTSNTVDDETVYDTSFVQGSIADMIYDWIDWRLAIEAKALDYRIGKANAAIDKQDLLLLAHKHRDILDACRDEKDPKAFLIKKLKVTSDGASYLLGLTVMQLTKINLANINQQIKELQQQMKDLKLAKKDLRGTVASAHKAAFAQV